jgi:hypothetical protein
MNAPLPPHPLVPVTRRWKRKDRELPGGLRGAFWRHPTGVQVISTIDHAVYPDGSGEVGPQWHISVARPRHRPSEADVQLALKAFGMVGAEEDNHHPGFARHYFLCVDPARRVACECKTTEVTIAERGYQWQNPVDDTACRGCEFAVLSRTPCPLHG